jgi:hypothetical protein
MKIESLSTLKYLVDEREIHIFGIYYPIVSPSLELKWTGFYQDQELNEFSVDGFDSFFTVCDALLKLIRKQITTSDLIKKLPKVDKTESAKIKINLEKIVDFINFQAMDESKVWLLGLEYNQELSDEGIWIGTIEGDIYLDMQISYQGSSINTVCEEICNGLIERGYDI